MTFSFTHGYIDADGFTASERMLNEQRRARRSSSARLLRAFRAHSLMGCIRADYLHRTQGYGAAGLAQNFDIPNCRTTQQADAAINAGRRFRTCRSLLRSHPEIAEEFDGLSYDDKVILDHYLNA